MMYPGCQTDRDEYGETALMLWIVCRPGEDGDHPLNNLYLRNYYTRDIKLTETNNYITNGIKHRYGEDIPE